MSERLDFDQLIRVIRTYSGSSIRIESADFENQELLLIFYDAMLVKCNIDLQYGRFGIAVVISEGTLVRDLFGEAFSQNNDEASIRASLSNVDEYCRLRLPDKYLDAYERGI